jgi:hypothetical protein
MNRYSLSYRCEHILLTSSLFFLRRENLEETGKRAPLLFKFHRTHRGESGMATNAIRKTFEICKDCLPGLLPRGETSSFHTLAFERTEKAFPGRVVVTLFNSAPANHHASLSQLARIQYVPDVR